MIDLAFCVLGVAVGLALGFLPAMHVNNFLPFFALLSLTSPDLFLFVIAASIAYVFSSFFPSVLLGVPNEDTALNVLPGHRIVLEGNAYSAIMISLSSGLFVTLLSAPFLIFFLGSLSIVYTTLQKIIPYLLIAIVIFMFFSDKKTSVIILSLSSMLGFLTFDFNLLLPLLTGFFGMSTVISSYSGKSRIPPQMLKFNSGMTLYSLSIVSFMSSFLSSIFGFIPAVSSAIVGTIGSYMRKLSSEEFLALLSGTNVAYMAYSFFALLLLHKTRSGSAVLLSQFFQSESIFFVLGIILFSSALSFLVCARLAKPIVRLYCQIDYRKACLFSMTLMVSVNAALTGWLGVLVLFAATSIGLLSNSLGVKRINCMAALIVPTIAVLL